MTLIEKRKSVQKGYVFTKGERCICWHYYPYNCRLAMVVGESKKYWILDDGSKYKKSDYNRSGFTGYSGAFIEPLTEDSLKYVCCSAIVGSIMGYLHDNRGNYDKLRPLYDALGLQDKEHKLSIYLIDRYQRTGSFEYTEEG